MAGPWKVLLAAGLLVVANSATSSARVRSGCPQLTDASGDVAFENPWSSSMGWDKRSLDVLSATVSADADYVTTSVRVARLAPDGDPAHAYRWSLRLAPETSRRGEFVWTRAARLTDGDRFWVEREYPTGGSSVGPAQNDSFHVDSAPAEGRVDVERGVVSVRIPRSTLTGWDIPLHAPVWEIYAYSEMVSGVGASPATPSMMESWEARPDETDHADLRARLDGPGCSPHSR